MRTWVLTTVLALMLSVAGCTGHAPISEAQPAVPDPELAAQLPDGSLLPLPVDRAASDAFLQCIYGSDAYDRSPNATEDGTKLILPTTAHEISWGIWRFPPKLDELIEFKAVIVQLSDWGDSSAYVGFADYEMGAWDFVECPGNGYIPVDAEHYVSPAGYWYIAIVASGGGDVDVHTLHLSIDDTWVIAPWIAQHCQAVTVLQALNLAVHGRSRRREPFDVRLDVLRDQSEMHHQRVRRTIVRQRCVTVAVDLQHDGSAVVCEEVCPRRFHDPAFHREAKMLNVPPPHRQCVFHVERNVFDLHCGFSRPSNSESPIDSR